MDLERKIGQMLMLGFDGPAPEPTIDLLREFHVGGFILFERNVGDCSNLSQVHLLTLPLHDAAAYAGLPGLLISIDQEGGPVTRLGPDLCPEFVSNRKHGDLYIETGDPSPVIEQAKLTAQNLIRLGINMNLAPVLDVVTVDGNEVIGDRSYGNDPDIVSVLGVEYILELQKNGVIATAKHFPGHGPTHIDSHIALPTTSIPCEEAEKIHLHPFSKAIDSGVDCVMTAHMVYVAYDSLPATLSHKLLTGQLRNRMGFTGVIITDDMNMLAIAENYDVEEAVVLSVNAGVDILLVCGDVDVQRRACNAIFDAVNSGVIKLSVIDDAVGRIINLKKKYGLAT